MTNIAQPPAATRKRRHWADALAVLTGVVLVSFSVWPGDIHGSAAAEAEAGNPGLLWLTHVTTGALVIAGVAVAQKITRRVIGRGLVIGAAVLLLLVLFVFRDFGPRALLTILMPAAILLVTSPFIGPLPRGPDWPDALEPNR